jgi:hypothetical protein
MAQTGYTPISIYYSSTASNTPTAGNLVAGELAINTADGKLFYKDSAGVVQVIGTKGGVGTSSTTQVLYNSSGLVVGSAGLTFDGTNLATTGTATATRFIPSGSTIATNGLYLPAANSIGISTNSTNAVYIDSTQNVGIGTSSPTYSKLHVVGNATIITSNFIDSIGTIKAASLANSTVNSAGLLFTAYDASNLPTNGSIHITPVANYRSNFVNTYMADGAGGAYIINQFVPSSSATAERMRIDSSGRVLVGLTSANTSGSNFQVSQGVTFPATQSASSDANTLDDYEEGTFTANLSDGTNNVSFTAIYTKIGRIVQLQFASYQLNISALTVTGTQLRITGIPFTSVGEHFYANGGIWLSNAGLNYFASISGTTLYYWYAANITDVNTFTKTNAGNPTLMSVFGSYTFQAT